MASEFNFRPLHVAALLATSFLLFAFIASRAQENPSRVYLGFDVNEYPGDQALPALRKTFAFAGYWLNVPPRADQNNWAGQRAAYVKNNFGFLVSFKGRPDKELSPASPAAELASSEPQKAIAAAKREGFPANTIIFLDQEE